MDFSNKHMRPLTGQTDSSYSINICGMDMKLKAEAMPINVSSHYMT